MRKIRKLMLAVAIGAASMSAQSAALLHHYTFAGTTVEDMAGSVDGTLLNGATINGGLLTLDGVNDYVAFGADLVPTSGSYTVALFARRDSAQAGSYTEFISQGFSGAGFYLGTDPTGAVRATDAWLPGIAAGAVGQLVHYALVNDVAANLSSLYIDGLLVATHSGLLANSSAGTDTRLGRQFDPFGEYFHGALGDLRIYDGALLATEVASIARPSAVPEPATLAMALGGLEMLRLGRRRPA